MPSPVPHRSTATSSGDTEIRRSWWIWGLPLVLTLASLWLIAGTQIPLGIPEEWTWSRKPLAPDYWWSLPSLGMIVGLFAAWIRYGYARIEQVSIKELLVWLSGSFLLAFSWLWVIQETAPGEMRLSKAAWILYYPGPSGYFTEARYRVTDLGDYLQNYQAKLREGDVLHIGTHPPGLIVGYRLLMACQQASPEFFRWLDDWQPLSARAALHEIKTNAAHTAMPVDDRDLSILWAAFLAMQLGAAFTVIPLYFLIREFSTRRTSWLLIHFWPFVPALNLFLPKSDAFFPWMSLSILVLWFSGWRRGSFLLCSLSGFVAWWGLFLSLAFLPVFFLTGLITLWISSPCTPFEERTVPSLPRIVRCGVAGLLGFAFPLLVLNLVWKINLTSIWWLNYLNHAGFYRQYTRTYWQWLWYNPLELSISLGIPVMWLFLRSTAFSMRFLRSRDAGISIAIGLTWSILWLSGKNMGEAGRLWLFLMPWGIWGAAFSLERLLARHSAPTPPRYFWCLWGTQVLACIGVAARMIGFDLAGG